MLFCSGNFYGQISSGCEPLTEAEYLDITQTIKNLEKKAEDNLKPYIDEESTEGYHAKIYQIECSSSYIKIMFIASIYFGITFLILKISLFIKNHF